MELISNFKPSNCSLCLNSFLVNVNYHGHKKPFLLQCGHSACDNCLHTELSSKNEVTCKDCEFVSTVPSNFTLNELAQYFPVNYFLIGLWSSSTSCAKANDLDALIKYSQPKKRRKDKIKIVTCTECMENQADSLCKQCGAPYCNHCFRMVHMSARALKSHVKVPLLETYLDLEVGKPLMCNLHSEAKLEFFCIVCKVPSCARCMIEKHQGHNMDLLENVKENCEDEFVDKYVSVTNILQRMKSSQKKVENIMNENKGEKQLKELHNKVYETYILLHGKLTVHQNSLHSKIHLADEIGQLESLSNFLTESINTTEALLLATKVLLRDANLQKPNIFVAVIDNLKAKEELPCFVVEEKNSTIPKLNVNNDIINDLVKVCDIELPESVKYKLVSEKDLPSGYEMQPLNEVSRNEVLSMMITSTTNSDVSSISSDNFSDRVVDSNFTSRTTSPDSTHSNQSIHSLKVKPSNDSYKYPDELSVGCQVRVLLCHLVSPSDFYVQRECAVKKLSDFQRSLRGPAITGQNPPVKCTKGPIYLVLYEKDNKYYRARILEIIDQDKYTVLYIDFGNTEVVNRNRIRLMPRHVTNMPVLAIRCKLNNCVPNDNNTEWDPGAIALMTKMIDNDFVSMVVKDRTPVSYIVDLYKFTECNIINIQQALSFFEFASLAAECEWRHLPSVQSVPDKVKLPTLKFHQGDIFEAHVSHVVSPHEFYIQNLLQSKRLIKMSEELQRSFNKFSEGRNTIYHPRKDMYVVAKHSRDGKWYRGRITDCLKGRTLRIFFIDFGVEEIIHWDNIKALLPRYSKIAPQAIRCTLSDVLPTLGESGWSAEVCTYFRNLTFNTNMKVVVHGVENEHLSIVLYKSTPNIDICINALIVKEEKAISTGINSTVTEHPKVISSHSALTAVKTMKPVVSSPPIEPEEPQITEENKLLLSTVKGPDGSLRIHVVIKRIVNPGEFFVCFAYLCESLLILENKLQRHYNTEKYESKEWEVDSVCAVSYNDKWYRALVLEKLPENKSKVNLVDQGFEVVLENSSICPLHESFTAMQDGVFKCHLGGLEPILADKWASSSINEMEDFINNHKEILYLRKMGQLKNSSMPIELFGRIEKPANATEPVLYEWKSLNHYLRFIGLAKSDGNVQWDCEGNILNQDDLGKSCEIPDLGSLLSTTLKVCSEESETPTQSNDPVNKSSEPCEGSLMSNVVSLPDSWIPAKPLEKLDFISCPTYVDSDCNIYLHDFHESSSLLEEISKALSMKYDGTLPKPSDATLQIGDICVAKYHVDNKWYRGLILGVLEELDEYLVQFVDYGNVENCKLAELRKSSVCHQIPIQATKCAFVDIEPISPNKIWKKEHIETIQFNLVDFRCQTELVIQPKSLIYGIKKIKTPDGKDYKSVLIKNEMAIHVNTSSIDFEILTEDKQVSEEIENSKESSTSESEKSEIKKSENKEKESKPHIDKKSDEKPLETKKAGATVTDWFTLTEMEQESTENSESQDGISEDTTTDHNGVEQENDELAIAHWSSCHLDLGDVKVEETVETKDIQKISSIEVTEHLEPVDNTETENKDLLLQSSEVNLMAEEIIEQEDEPLNVIESLAEDDNSVEDVESKHFHWSSLQDLNCIEDTVKYKEIVIPPSVDLLLVEATAFHTPTILVIHLFDIEEDPNILDKINKFKELSGTLQKEGPEQPLLKKPYKGKVCCALFSIDQQWYRGFVIGEYADDKLLIQFVDYGNVEIVPTSSVRELKEEWADLEVLGLLCELNNVSMPKDKEHSEVLNSLTEVLANSGQLRAVIKERKPKLKVDLYKGDNLAYEDLIDQGLLEQT